MIENKKNIIRPLDLTNNEFLVRHSYDAVVFPRYLEILAKRVEVKLRDYENNCDVYAVYVDENGNFNYKYARLTPNNNGARTDNNEIYTAIHDVFAASKSSGSYIGFRGCGRIPIGPLFQVGFFYEKYGRGIFKNGDFLPTPCSRVESEYGIKIENFRTVAPLG